MSAPESSANMTPNPNPDDTSNDVHTPARGGARNTQSFSDKRAQSLLLANVQQFVLHFECGCVQNCAHKLRSLLDPVTVVERLRRRRFTGEKPGKMPGTPGASLFVHPQGV